MTPTRTPQSQSRTHIAESHIPGSIPDSIQHRPAGERGDGLRRRRILRSVGGLLVACLLVGLGAVMTSNANFSRTYVRDQLMRQGITFKPLDALTDQERGHACVVENAGKQLTTGKQAECFANDFIGGHIPNLANGQTYAQVSNTQMALRARVAEAQANGDPNLPALQKELTDVSRQSDTLFKAESLRGMLLTSFGFSELGEKGAQAATAAYGAAALIGALSIGGLVWAFVRPRTTSAAGR